MPRNIVAYKIPSTMKLSDIIKHFEIFGDVTKAAVDEQRRRNANFFNVFISFADQVGANRAVEASIININGHRVKMEISESNLNFGPRKIMSNFEIIRRRHDNDNKRHNFRPRSRSPQDRAASNTPSCRSYITSNKFSR